MKKLLLATTMIVGTAGFAAAEVTLSGDARMGITKAEGSDAVFSNRARVKFTLSGETDTGLSFGASFRAGDAAGAAAGAKGTVSVSGAFGSISMGDESAAAEYAVGDLAMKSFAGVGDSNETAFLTGAKVVYTYTAGDLSVFVSTGQNGSDDNSIGVKYTAGALTVGAGYETDGTASHTAASVAYAMGDTTIKAVYGEADLKATAAVNGLCIPAAGGLAASLAPGATCTGVVTLAPVAASAGLSSQMGVSVSHTMGAISLAAFYRVTEDAKGVESDFSGVGASYDLGGGASVNGGVADVNGSTLMDLGVNFAF